MLPLCERVIDDPRVRRDDEDELRIGSFDGFHEPAPLRFAEQEQVRIETVLRVVTAAFAARVENEEVAVGDLPVIVMMRADAVGGSGVFLEGGSYLEVGLVEHPDEAMHARVGRRLGALVRVACLRVGREMNRAYGLWPE